MTELPAPGNPNRTDRTSRELLQDFKAPKVLYKPRTKAVVVSTMVLLVGRRRERGLSWEPDAGAVSGRPTRVASSVPSHRLTYPDDDYGVRAR